MLRTAIAISASALLSMAGTAHAAPVFSNFNGNGVAFGNAGAVNFNIAADTDITRIDIYTAQWNGNPLIASGTVSFFNSLLNTTTDIAVSRSIGPTSYARVDTSWLTFIGLEQLAAGTYTVTVDSSLQAQWAHNGQSSNRGFLSVEGVPTQQVPEPASLALVALGLLAAVGARRKSA